MRDELIRLREKMAEEGMDAYLIVSDDYHMSEYVGAYFKCREYISGFDGSAGSLVITKEEAGLWTDGRYFLQAEKQLKGSGIALYRSGEENVPTMLAFLKEKMKPQEVLGFDGRTVSIRMAEQLIGELKEQGVSVQTDLDLVGAIWENRPKISAEQVWFLADKYAGESREEKIAKVRGKLQELKADYFLIPSLDEIAWILNVRGNDVMYNPVVLSYLLIGPKRICWYVNPSAVSEEKRTVLEQMGIICRNYMDIYQDLQELSEEDSILIDENKTNYALYDAIPKGVHPCKKTSPIELMKAVKNRTEMQNVRKAHLKDGVALTRLIYWLKHMKDKTTVTELDVCRKLEEFRREETHYLGPSFAPIAAYGAHGAIVHYEPTEETNSSLDNKGFLLLDTGGQYLYGTTDVTRTIALGELTEEEKLHYTAVLRGNLNLAAARFQHGCTGMNLDYAAREPLWQMGLDYNHGTGHGVGYLLSVHEGPHAIRCRERDGRGTVLEEGMITSDEPGLYLAGQYGIRLENLMLCTEAEKNSYGTFMRFETLTLVPFDMEAVCFEALSDREQSLLRAYQQSVYTALAGYLPAAEQEWLKEQVR